METKMTPAGDGPAANDALLRTLDAYRETNDGRLAEIEKKGAADALLDDKLKRVDAALDRQKTMLDRLALEAARPGLEGPGASGDPEHKSAWSTYIRKGDESGLARLDTKSLNVGTDDQGGYVAPPELDRLIEARLTRSSPMRAIASVRQSSSAVFKKPVSLGSAASWVTETAARTETAAPTLSLLSFPSAELYAMPAATQTLLDDAYADIDEWLAEEVETAFSAQESDAFVNGDGANKPKGFLRYTAVADAAHAWDKIGYVATGEAGGFDATDPSEALLDLIYAPRQEFRPNGRFVMNRRTVSAVRKLTDASGQYLWSPGGAGEPSTLLGYPVTEVEDMPDIEANKFAIAFGDFRRGYLIVDRQGARVLRDPYSAKPYVLFYTTKRVGGGVQNFDAIKLLKFSAS